MRTLIVIVVGLVLSAAFVYGAGFINRGRAGAPINGAYLFLGVWLVFCIVDYYFGLKAGYGAVEELGVHAVVYLIPAALAWYLSRSH